MHKNTSVEKIISECEGITRGLTKQILKLYLRKGILSESGKKLKERYTYLNTSEDFENEVLEDNFGADSEGVPIQVKNYNEEYGFEAMLEDVSRWTNHDGRIIKEYSTDRLWLGRYIDYLDKAKQYFKWFESDQAIARKKINQIKNG